jgi:predicted SAM-dependent methyltransferase
MYFNHKSILSRAGCEFPVGRLVEIGPGDSIGIGLMALIEGTSKYYALDAIEHADKLGNIKMLGNLKYQFEKLGTTLNPKIFKQIEFDILTTESHESNIKYYAPWYDSNAIKEESVDLIISNAVMEHVLDLETIYKNTFKWLKPGGYVSHIIDYTAHEFSNIWYQHWEYSKPFWKFLMHGRKYPMNRMPHSFHEKCLLNAGFEVFTENCTYNETNKANYEKIDSLLLSYFSRDDLRIQSARIVAKKPTM